jgi:hypothetical protein
MFKFLCGIGIAQLRLECVYTDNIMFCSVSDFLRTCCGWPVEDLTTAFWAFLGPSAQLR